MDDVSLPDSGRICRCRQLKAVAIFLAGFRRGGFASASALLLSETLDAAPSSPRIVSRNSGASFLYGELEVAFMPSLAEPPLPDTLPPADGV
ncbi:hypothetical protein PF001_g9313 [Phytophthora fragariae]|uniref:Uncharacterized protein n=1 Tax=Phytophthora fragariae TaxID=53985 RepID=A0A6A4DTV5_9STRA|nr:hypothetical protein PF004_g8810 [Phytophthora fragariae]KAE9312266.1 hypothetical protein PF001_g9313 [Phytophthora fragariae]